MSTSTQEFHNPLYQPLPTTANPTDILAARFSTWRAIIKGLITYLKDVISVHEESILQQVRLQHSIASNFPMTDGSINLSSQANASNGNANSQTSGNSLEEINNIKRYFLPFGSGSIVDIPNAISDYHKLAGSYGSRTAKELASTLIPKLEDLRRDLSIKIREIKNLSSDFKNTIPKEITQTKAELNNFYTSIDQIKSLSAANLIAKQDPYLTKIYLDKQIKKQLLEENYLHEAFVNLQTSGKELEKLVVLEIQSVLKVYARLIGEEAQVVFNSLIPKLDNGFVTKAPEFEWDSFIKENPKNFINIEEVKVRKFSDINYKYNKDPLTFEIRSSYLERRSKYLKSYTRGYYVLTPTFIHEFKSADRKKDIIPIMSISLNDCQVSEHSKKDATNPNTWHKFVLHTKQNGIIHRGHNWILRAESYDLMMSWYNDLKKLTQLPTPEARASYIADRMDLKKQKNVRKSLQLHSSSDLSLINSIQRDINNKSVASSTKRMSAPVGNFNHTQGQFSAALGQAQEERTQVQEGNIITSLDSISDTNSIIGDQKYPQSVPSQQVQQQQAAYDTPQHQRSFSLQQQNQQQLPIQMGGGYYANSPSNLQRSTSLAVPHLGQHIPMNNNPIMNGNNGSQSALNRSMSMMTQNYRPQTSGMIQYDNQQPQQPSVIYVDNNGVPIQQQQPSYGQVDGNLNYQLQQQLQQQQLQQQYMMNNNNNPAYDFSPIGATTSNNTYLSHSQQMYNKQAINSLNTQQQIYQPSNSFTNQAVSSTPVPDIHKDDVNINMMTTGNIEHLNGQFSKIDMNVGSSSKPIGAPSTIVEGDTIVDEKIVPQERVIEENGKENQNRSNNDSDRTVGRHDLEESFGTNATTFVQNNNSFTAAT